MNLAIAAPRPAASSESFIQMQLTRLPCLLRIHGGPVATQTLPGGRLPLLPALTALADSRLIAGLLGRSPTGGLKGRLRPLLCSVQGRSLEQRLRRMSIDVLLANFGPAATALLPVCRRLDLPLVAHFHGADAHTHALIAQHADGYRQLAKEAAAIVAVSLTMIEQLCRLGFPREKIHLIRCGADSARFGTLNRKPESVPLFLGIGRFVEKKAPHLTLEAFQRVRERLPAARLVLAGDGDLLESTRSLARALGLADCVEFPGAVPHEEVVRLMARATAFVQHSTMPQTGPNAGDSEGTPVALLEAMLTGLPVVVTRHAGMGEIVQHGADGLLVEERDTQGMADAMLRVATDPHLAASLGEAARTKILSSHTDRHYLDALTRLLQAVATTPRAETQPGK